MSASQQEVEKNEGLAGGAIAAIVVSSLLWLFLVIGAVIVSITCVNKSGTDSQKIVGVIIALIFGPFYWLYYLISRKSGYCN